MIARLGWPVTGILVAVLVITGAAIAARRRHASRFAQLVFSAAALVVIGRVAWWLAYDTSGVAPASRLLVGGVVMAIAVA